MGILHFHPGAVDSSINFEHAAVCGLFAERDFAAARLWRRRPADGLRYEGKVGRQIGVLSRYGQRAALPALGMRQTQPHRHDRQTGGSGRRQVLRI